MQTAAPPPAGTTHNTCIQPTPMNSAGHMFSCPFGPFFLFPGVEGGKENVVLIAFSA